MTDTPNPAMAHLLSQLGGGNSKKQLLAQMLMQQQQSNAETDTAGGSQDKLKGQLKRLSQQNQQLKQRLSRAGRERRELLEYLDYLLDLNQGFSAAVGACECWGEDEECTTCQGDGTPGWQPRQEEAFAAMVAPALSPKEQIATPSAPEHGDE